MINSYSFGCMIINSKSYHKDLMILPDETIFHPWWRKAGHTLSLPDIQEIIAAAPDILVIGTGSPGMMQPEQTLCSELKSRGIEKPRSCPPKKPQRNTTLCLSKAGTLLPVFISPAELQRNLKKRLKRALLRMV